MIRSVILSFLFLISAGSAQVITDFDTDSLENWRSEGDGKYYLEYQTGNPGNCMRVDDDATGDLNIAIAPLKFVGDWSVSDTTDSVFADVFIHRISGSALANRWIFRISGPGGIAIAPIPTPVHEQWVHISVPMNPANWTVQSGTWPEILANVNHVEVPAEFINGDEFVRLDNIGLTFDPVVVPLDPPVSTDFENGSYQGWVFYNSGGVSVVPTGGNPGKFCQISDAAGITMANAPAKYLGDWSQLNGTAALQIDLKITGFTGGFMPGEYLWRISGPGGSAIIPADSMLISAFDQWTSFSAMISESHWQIQTGSWADLLANVTELRMICEFINGGETVQIDNINISNNPPVAGFSASRTYIFPGDDVQFTDQSTFVPNNWLWTFGDGSSSDMQNPAHTYDTPGVFDVQLTVTNAFGQSVELKESFIEVHESADSVLFADDFEDNVIHPGWQFRNGTWVERTKRMEQNSNYYGTGYLAACYALTGSRYWKNYRLSADMMSSDNDRIGLVFNYQDETNFYLFSWRNEDATRYLKKFVDGVATDLFFDDSVFTVNQWYHVEIITENGKITCSIDSTELFSVTDSTFLTGKAGLYCWGNQNSYWDNFSVIQLAEPVNGLETFDSANIVRDFELDQNYPNPFNPVTMISYNLPKAQDITLEVYNISGQRIAILAKGEYPAGKYEVPFDGRGLPSGIYFYRLMAEEFSGVRRMVLIK